MPPPALAPLLLDAAAEIPPPPARAPNVPPPLAALLALLVAELVTEDNVLVQPGFFFDFDSEAFLVLSLLTEPARFQEGCRRLLARVDSQ